ncbi:glyoxalase [Halorientalis sp. IM1011]|uniref:VOC family protein n=1 Tax=Halorientalis sp. IM1011 TaxID=1932360 RepID=UPI00097CC323|nr:VOC family protein [Halorientalis sp. IM1011]AQL41891.1 glyoxalase [Halorientalis sp. IM1011]
MTARTGTLPADTHVGRVTLAVGDLDPTLAFYRDVVGLRVHEERDDEATLGDGTTSFLSLRERPDARPRGATAAGLFHTAFCVPSRAALGDALERIDEQWRLDGASDHRVSEALYLSDPEDNGVEIYHDRPRSEWPVGDDGRVQMATLPLPTDDLASAADGRDRVPEGTDIGHVHLEATDLAAARRFYVDGLRLRVRQEFGSDALFLAAGDYHHHVGVNTWNGRTEPAGERGLAQFELVVPDADALDAVADRLTDLDVAVTGRADELSVADPDGIDVVLRTDD